MEWRARAAAHGQVLLEYRAAGQEWWPARTMTAWEADELGIALRVAAQESRRVALVVRAHCHGGDCADFPDCACGGWKARR